MGDDYSRSKKSCSVLANTGKGSPRQVRQSSRPHLTFDKSLSAACMSCVPYWYLWQQIAEKKRA